MTSLPNEINELRRRPCGAPAPAGVAPVYGSAGGAPGPHIYNAELRTPERFGRERRSHQTGASENTETRPTL
ncbi:unnamed protein product [Boreogadus saida]